MIDVNIINDVTFATSFRGYDKDEVDNFLEELAKLAQQSNTAALESERKVAELAAKCKKLESAGSDAIEDRERIINEANKEREALIAEAKKTLESARAKEREAAIALERAKAGEGSDSIASSAAVQARFEDERTNAAARQEAIKILTEAKERAKAHTDAANAAIKNAIATAKTRIEAADKAAQERAQETDRLALERAQASERDAFERAQASDLAAKERAAASDRRAQEKADAILQEARGNADHITDEAKTNAAKIVADAEAKVKDMFARAEASIAAKREEFERLRETSREFSGEYSRLLNEQLREMTELAEKMNETSFGEDYAIGNSGVDAVISPEYDGEIEIDNNFDSLKLDDLTALLNVDSTVQAEPSADIDTEIGTALEDVSLESVVDSDNAAPDDDTYDFVGAPAAPDGTEADLTISDADLDRIFSFNVDEIMSDDTDKDSDI